VSVFDFGRFEKKHSSGFAHCGVLTQPGPKAADWRNPASRLLSLMSQVKHNSRGILLSTRAGVKLVR
jgi:hypothetical protein